MDQMMTDAEIDEAIGYAFRALAEHGVTNEMMEPDSPIVARVIYRVGYRDGLAAALKASQVMIQ